MTTVLLLAGVWLLAFLIFCVALCKAASQPVPGLRHPHPTILVIDDDASVLRMVRLGLESEGYNVLSASDPKEGIKVFQEQSRNVSLVLLDFHMPDMNGDAVFEALRKIDPQAPVLLITGFSADMKNTALQNKVRGCLLKPFPLGDLISKVHELISPA
ncbi:MAG: response regulator [Verrucomicrobia bacterium]|nr:response regulator [Verrucomicrobiota bacterium]